MNGEIIDCVMGMLNYWRAPNIQNSSERFPIGGRWKAQRNIRHSVNSCTVP
jgi:hypothetical protein